MEVIIQHKKVIIFSINIEKSIKIAKSKGNVNLEIFLNEQYFGK